MPRAFADISFTPSVKAAQTRYSSRENNRGFEQAEDPRNELQDHDIEFIEARDSFYQASVGENGWPYVQHRGGPAGFLRVLDARTIGYADFRGNAQYLSVGNLNANERISLILMDYANRRRLKLWGRARIVHEADAPELIAQLEVPSYRARVERGVLIHIEAIEWNCPQHITPRFTEAELEQVMAPLLEENRALRAQVQTSATPAQLGQGELTLVISGVRQLSPRVRAYELRHPQGEDLPKVSAGSHLQVPVRLPDGGEATRHYSISSNPARRDAYEIAVLHQPESGGGSAFIHQHYQIGMQLRCGLPRNDFALHDDARPAVLIAGGIGITPIKAMALALKAQGRSFEIHYAGRSLADMAYRDRMQREFGPHLSVWPSAQGTMPVAEILRKAPTDAVFYVCGPQRLIDGVQTEAAALGIRPDRIRSERFSAPAPLSTPQTIEVELRRSGKTLQVAPEQSILAAVEAAGIPARADCRVGNCGSCAVKVIEGRPVHADKALSERERKQGQMCICVSRASTHKLVLDL